MFNKEPAFPEKIDEAICPFETPDRFFERGDGPTRYVEHLKELVPEGLSLSLFAGFPLPVMGELNSAAPDFIA
jgi:hypothetical protein